MHDVDILPVELMARREPGSLVEPMLRLEIQAAQQLMDELWQCGLRPTEGTGSAGSLKATENHLADMKRIVFTLLERPNVEVSGVPHHETNKE